MANGPFKILFGKNFTMLILFLIFLICCPAITICECGIKQASSSMTMEAKLHPFIAGGEIVDYIKEWPWMAFLQMKLNDCTIDKRCTATIIDQKYLLTAAHCEKLTLLREQHADFDAEYPDAHYQVIVGTNDNKNYKPENVHRVKRYLKHPNFTLYTDTGGLSKFDIMILELDNKLEFGEKVQPICLPNDFNQHTAAQLQWNGSVAGWGSTIHQPVYVPDIDVPRRPPQHEVHPELLHEGQVQLIPMEEFLQAQKSMYEEALALYNYTARRIRAEHLAFDLIRRIDQAVEFHTLKGMLPEEIYDRIHHYKFQTTQTLDEIVKIIREVTNEEFQSKEQATIKESEGLLDKLYEANADGLIAAKGIIGAIKKGDSGGPLMMELDKRVHRWYQVGVAQAIIPNLLPNDPIRPFGYTAIAQHCAWIEETTEGAVKCVEPPRV